MNPSTTDRIEKQIELAAAPARVWRALTDQREFGAWFGVRLDGPFACGSVARGRITHPGYDHLVMELQVERMESEKLFSYRWHPYAVDPKMDYSREPMTLVEFRLSPSPRGTLLTIVESGFDALPASRRDEAFRMNSGGWEAQRKNIESHVTAAH